MIMPTKKRKSVGMPMHDNAPAGRDMMMVPDGMPMTPDTVRREAAKTRASRSRVGKGQKRKKT